MTERARIEAALAQHRRLARVVVAEVAGSVPRETGTAMLIWADGSEGTIGGGALEWEAMARARAMLARHEPGPHLSREPLGPKLGQCCGGAVTLLTEIFDEARPELLPPEQGLWLRAVTPQAQARAALPFALRRIVAEHRQGRGSPVRAGLVQGHMIEALLPPPRDLWIWGAGHVGRALTSVFAPLPDWRLTWIDSGRERFPDALPPGVRPLYDPQMARFCAGAPPGAHHLILTFSHALDLEICHRLLLGGGFSFLGLIGSDTKRARFRSRLSALGHGEAALARFTCPIGVRQFGKHPQAIAIGVAHQLLQRHSEAEITDDISDRHLAPPQRTDESLSRSGGQQRRLLRD